MTGIVSGSLALTWNIILNKTMDWSQTITAGPSGYVLNDPAFIFGASGSRAINLIYWDTLPLAAAAVTVNTFGVLTDACGDLISPAFIKALVVGNMSTTPGQTLVVGNAAATPFIDHLAGTTPRFNVGPGGYVCFCSPISGYAAGTGAGNIKFDPGANSYNCQWGFVGSTA